MHIDDDAKATLADLSPVGGQFADHVVSHPEAALQAVRLKKEVPAWLTTYEDLYQVQPWPVFIGDRRLAELEHAVVGLTDLIRALPEKLFARDPQEAASYFAIEDLHLATLILSPPNGLAGCLARCDMTHTDEGFSCMEINVGGNLGGWQLRFWDESCRTSALFRSFAESLATEPVYRDPFATLFEHVIRETMAVQGATEGRLAVALVVGPQAVAAARAVGPSLQETFRAALERVAPGTQGTLHICRYHDVVPSRSGRSLVEGEVVSAIIENTSESTPPSVFRSFKSGLTLLYNGPISELVGSKRALALLSDHRQWDCFEPAERELIDRHVPWTRMVTPDATEYRGESRDMSELLLADRGRFVLKPASGASGKGVAVGRHRSAEEWAAAVAEAMRSRDWIAQEYLESRPYPFPAKDGRIENHHVVWGGFCFGPQYGGGFLRAMRPGAGDGVINTSRGATEGFFYEI